jgi:hypothetical protein
MKTYAIIDKRSMSILQVLPPMGEADAKGWAEAIAPNEALMELV